MYELYIDNYQCDFMLTAVSGSDITLLRVFMAVADEGGFSAAQVSLNVSQPTISTQMAALESRLGVKLCRRGRAGFSLTEDGLKVYNAAEEFFEGCNKFVTQVNEIHDEVSGDLRIAIADALVGNPDFPISEVIRQMRMRAPNVNITLSEVTPIEMGKQLLDQRLHAAVHSFPNHISGLRYLPLFDEKQILYCGKGHALFDREDHTISISDIEKYDYARRTYYGGLLKMKDIRPTTMSASCDTMDGLVAFILSGEYLGHLPWRRAGKWVADGKLRPIREDKLSYFTHHECCILCGPQKIRFVEIFEEIIRSNFPTSYGNGDA